MVSELILTLVGTLFLGSAALSTVPVEGASETVSSFRTEVSDVEMPFVTDSQASENYGVVNITCTSGKTIVLPHNGILLEHGPKRILWCPNAKVATSTIFRTFAYLHGEHLASETEAKANSDARIEGRQTTVHNLIQSGQEKKLCDGVPFSFTVVRNPWDRVYSAYLDKINRVVFVPGHRHATFQQFLHAISTVDPAAMNAHWQPVSQHCATAGPNRFGYSKVYKVEEHFEESIAEAFGHLGFSKVQTRAAMEDVGQQNVGESDHTIKSRLKAYETLDARQIIRDIYHDDIEVGRYEFGSK